MSNLLVYGLIALAVLASLAGLYERIHHGGVIEGEARIQKRWDEANAAARARERKQVAIAVDKKEQADAKEKVVYRTVKEYVDRIVDRPVYRNVCLDADGLRVARCAIRGESPDRCTPDGPVPPAAGSDRWHGQLHLAMDYGGFQAVPGVRPAPQGAR